MLYPTELLTNLSISKAGLEPATLRVTGDNQRASARTNCSQSTGKLMFWILQRLYRIELPANRAIDRARIELATNCSDNPKASARTNCSQSTGKLNSLGWFRFTVDNPEPIGPYKNLV